jgi:hypothetical protein
MFNHNKIMTNTPKDGRPLKHCVKCDTEQSPMGGVQYTPQRWVCRECFRLSRIKQVAQERYK